MMGITEPYHAEALRLLIAHALESVREIVTITDLDDRFTFVNQAFLNTYGYTRDEVLGQHVSLIASANNPSGLHLEILAQSRTGGWKGELLNRTKAGREFPIALSTSCIRDGSGKILGLIGIAEDIALRRQAADALVSRTKEIEGIRAISEEILRELDLATVLTLIIQRAADLTGAGSGMVYLWDEEAQVLLPAAWHGRGEWRKALRLRPGQGVAGTVALRREGMVVNDYRNSPYAQAITLEHSQISTVLGEPLLSRDALVGVIVVDKEGDGAAFTAKDRETLALFAAQAAIAIENARLYAAAERAAREIRSLYEIGKSLTTSLDLSEVLHHIAVKTTELLDTPHAQVVLWDEETQCLRLGTAYGTEADRVAKQEFRLGEGVNGIVAQTRAPLVVNDYQAFPHRVPERAEIVADIAVPLLYRDRFLGVLNSHATQPGSTFTQDHLAILTSFAAQAAIAIENARLYETARGHAAELEARVRERTADLEEALRVKAQFLANMSHELRTPLNAVLGFSEVLLGRNPGDLTPKEERYLQQIHHGGKRLLELVTDLLEMTESQAGMAGFRLDRLAVSDLFGEVLGTLAVAARAKRVELGTILDPGLPTVVADRRKLAQILHHLVTNAIRYTPAGGRITVGARRIGTPEGEEAEIAVADTGLGIRAEDLERIFRGFEQVDSSDSRQHGGSGLGLALVRRFVELHGGRVWAESDGEGRGARFLVRLPLLAAPPAKRILVVEDEAPVLEALGTALTAAGYLVDRAPTGAEALDRLAATPPSLLVLDIGLPDVDGWEVLRRVRRTEHTRDLPILVLTGLEHVHADQALALGADEFLAKPVSAQVLVETVGRLLMLPAAARSAGLSNDA